MGAELFSFSDAAAARRWEQHRQVRADFMDYPTDELLDLACATFLLFVTVFCASTIFAQESVERLRQDLEAYRQALRGA